MVVPTSGVAIIYCDVGSSPLFANLSLSIADRQTFSFANTIVSLRVICRVPAG